MDHFPRRRNADVAVAGPFPNTPDGRRAAYAELFRQAAGLKATGRAPNSGVFLARYTPREDDNVPIPGAATGIVVFRRDHKENP